jgi:hypothetical protein
MDSDLLLQACKSKFCRILFKNVLLLPTLASQKNESKSCFNSAYRFKKPF